MLNEIKSERCEEERGMVVEWKEDRRVRDFCSGDDRQEDLGKWTIQRTQRGNGGPEN